MCRSLGLDDAGPDAEALARRILDAPAPSNGAQGALDFEGVEIRPDGSVAREPARPDLLEPPPPDQLTVEALERHLWSAADILRGSIDSSDYEAYIFGLLFLKRLSDVFVEEAEKVLADGEDAEVAWEALATAISEQVRQYTAIVDWHRKEHLQKEMRSDIKKAFREHKVPAKEAGDPHATSSTWRKRGSVVGRPRPEHETDSSNDTGRTAEEALRRRGKALGGQELGEGGMGRIGRPSWRGRSALPGSRFWRI